MAANKRITDLTDYTSVLPYASELFGVYQPLLGWRSKRRLRQIRWGTLGEDRQKLVDLGRYYEGVVDVKFNADDQPTPGRIAVGRPAMTGRPLASNLLLGELSAKIQAGDPSDEALRDLVSEPRLRDLLNGRVFELARANYLTRWQAARGQPGFDSKGLQADFVSRLREESAFAGVLSGLAERGKFDEIRTLFFNTDLLKDRLDRVLATAVPRYDDPFLTFDPTKEIKDVTLSPIGVVHLYRQFFFELDTFLGTPVGHVWLSPGGTVELIEVSTRKTTVEKTIETSLETTTKTERSATDQDEISDAVKQDNREDMKLGFSTTVNQSWGSGNATATGSLNMDKTQQTGREQAHKRMRQQTDKLSTEIRQNYKSTFKTITETTDTSSKRYVLSNATQALMNYELRRKMRQVGVQIQDVGTYLCWETFVDDPGRQLALPDLIHIAKPADLAAVPNANHTPPLTSPLSIVFSGEAVWNFPDNSRQNGSAHPETGGKFVPIATLDIPGIPADYEVDYNPADPFLPIEKSVVAAEDDESWNAVNWWFQGMITPDRKRVMLGVVTSPDGLAWDDRITFKVSGAVNCRPTQAKVDAINAANSAVDSAKQAANEENQRNFRKAALDAISERVTLASKVVRRKFEDLREEERTIVYRNLIKALMTEHLYKDIPDSPAGHQARHVLSELINAIFDVDKMLYFVAPEWWRPRRTAAGLSLGVAAIQESINGSVVTWADDNTYAKYFITEKSDPAPLGSSLGWLLQLDGDDLRNAFLNAPWVKAVIPIRPGKELAAINWLKTVGVEGSDGLDAAYAAPADELAAIRASLLAHDPADPVIGHASVTLDDAIRDLCLSVADKHLEEMKVGRYPKEEINDDNRVSATPVEKVYEHGFYPLKGGFKAITEGNFEVCSQWIEVLPTDQVVPVEVKYDPKTGRQA